MARIILYSIFVLLVFRLELSSCEPFTVTAIGIISKVRGIIDFIWGKIDTLNEVQGKESEEVHIYEVNHKLDAMTEEIIKAVTDANKAQTLKDRIHEATDAIDQIDEWYEDMVAYNKTLSIKNPDEGMISEADKRLDNGPDGPQSYLSQLYKLFIDEGDENILKLVADIKKGYTGTCSGDSSLQAVQQVLQQFYILTAIAAAKTYLTTVIAVDILKKSNTHHSQVEYAETLDYIKRTILEQDQEAVDIFKQYLKKASREVWRCDPDQQIEDVTYTRLNKLFQKYFIHEHDLGVQINDCTGSCKSFGNPVVTEMCNPEASNSVILSYSDEGIFVRPGRVTDQNSGSLCRNQNTCSGGLYDCDYFGIEYRLIYKNDYLDICHSDRNSNRRYDYAVKTYGSGGAVTDRWGHVDNCKGFNSSTSPHLHKTKQCEVCICTCAEDSRINPDEYISLVPVFSTTSKNRIVTGARIIKKYNTIRLEIQEGILGKAGTIVDNSASWLNPSYKKPTKQDVNNRVYHKIHWNGGRAINLKDANAPKGHAIVGLAFEHSDQYGLYLVIFSRPFNFTTGDLQLQNERTPPLLPTVDKLNLEDRDIPTLSTRKCSVSETNKLAELTTTGLKADIGQTLIPFWDIQDVTTTTRAPMSGAGLYYKTFDKYGGFLGLKLYTYDIESHF